MSVPPPAAPADSSALHMLVYAYLLHTNCGRTAKAFARTSGLATSGRLLASDAPAYLAAASDDDDASAAPDCRASQLIDHHIERLRIRQSICASIEAGEPEVAADLLATYFRPVLTPAPPPSGALPASALPRRRELEATLLRFRLDTQHYIELIASRRELDALKFGQRTLWRYPEIFEAWLDHSLGFAARRAESPPARAAAAAATAKPPANGKDAAQPPQPQPQPVLSLSPPAAAAAADDDDDDDDLVPREELKAKRADIMQYLTDVAALVAYPDPRKSTLAYLLSQDRRRELAAAVNEAILASMRFPREPALVTLVRQLATASAYLVGYRASARSPPSPAATAADDARPRPRQPWVLDAFVNSESVADAFA